MVMIMMVVRKFRRLWRETWFQAILTSVFLLSWGSAAFGLLRFLATHLSSETIIDSFTGIRFLGVTFLVFGLITSLFAIVFSIVRNFRIPLRLPDRWWFLSVGLAIIGVAFAILVFTAAVSLGIVLGLLLGTTIVVAAATTLFVGIIIAEIESFPDIVAEIRRLSGRN